MRAFDLLRLILENLGRRKARVGLTAVGVVIGTAAVVVLVSLAIGLQRNATEQLGGISDLTRIEVYPGYNFETFGGGGGGGMVAVEVVGGPGQPAGQVLITDQSLADFAALPGVTEAYPRDGGGLPRPGTRNGRRRSDDRLELLQPQAAAGPGAAPAAGFDGRDPLPGSLALDQRRARNPAHRAGARRRGDRRDAR